MRAKKKIPWSRAKTKGPKGSLTSQSSLLCELWVDEKRDPDSVLKNRLHVRDISQGWALGSMCTQTCWTHAPLSLTYTHALKLTWNHYYLLLNVGFNAFPIALDWVSAAQMATLGIHKNTWFYQGLSPLAASLEVDFDYTMRCPAWLLETELWSSTRVASVLNCWGFYPAPRLWCFHWL